MADKRFRALSRSVTAQPPNGGIAPNLRSTGEYMTARSFFGKERALGIFELENLPAHQFALAVAAIAGLAAVRKRDIRAMRGVEDRFAIRCWNRFVAIDEGDLVHGRSHS